MNNALETLPDKLRQAIRHVVFRQGFYASLLLSTPIQAHESVKTMATDGRRIFFNPAFVAAHSMEDLTFVLMHELEHITRRHASRRQGRDPELWNIAADYVINLDLIEMGVPAPRFMGRFIGLYNPAYRDWPTEKVYSHLSLIFKRGTLFKGGKLNRAWYHRVNPLWADVLDEGQVADPRGKADYGDTGALPTIRHAMAQAVISHPGSLPGHLGDGSALALKNAVDWQTRLWQFMTEGGHHLRYDSWQRPNRRARHRGIRLPTSTGGVLSHLVLILDVSGSMNGILPSFLNELRNVVRQCEPLKTDILLIDDCIRGHWQFSVELLPDAPSTLLEGVNHGGDTDLTCGFEWVEEEGLRAPTVLCFTDMYSPFPETFKYADRTLFISNDDMEPPPFGSMIVIEPK